jgi:hypothetical protein
MFGPAFGMFERRGGIKRDWQMLCVQRNRSTAVQVQGGSRPIILEIVGDGRRAYVFWDYLLLFRETKSRKQQRSCQQK